MDLESPPQGFYIPLQRRDVHVLSTFETRNTFLSNAHSASNVILFIAAYYKNGLTLRIERKRYSPYLLFGLTTQLLHVGECRAV